MRISPAHTIQDPPTACPVFPHHSGFGFQACRQEHISSTHFAARQLVPEKPSRPCPPQPSDMAVSTAPGVTLLGLVTAEQADIITPQAQEFVARLHRCFNGRRLQLLAARDVRQKQLDAGEFPNFLASTAAVREEVSWRCAPPAPGLIDRRVEITGPVDAKMVINALNSGATQFMADFEDSHSPTWAGNLDGQRNMREALRRTLTFTAPGTGKVYRLNPKVATLLIRPRGWHLEEAHFLVDGQRCSGSLFDFGIYFYHCCRLSLAAGQGPYFYLPKMESHLEARLWNDVFCVAQDMLDVPRGTIRATVLIETILASFEMEEILFELRDHSAGLNCGRWDYIFSTIKKLRNHPQFVLPNRGDVNMSTPFLANYVKLLIRTCHKRGAHAMGGMAAQIPIKNDPAANNAAMTKVRGDKLREVQAGHDGTWVAHPELVKIALEVFNKNMPQPNQLYVRAEGPPITAADLLTIKGIPGTITAQGLRGNLEVTLVYMEAWLRGVGCVPIDNLMEDAATAEISRSQIWQWVRHGAKTAEGRVIDAQWVTSILQELLATKQRAMGPEKYAASKYPLASRLVASTVQGKEYSDFLTSLCYEHIVTIKGPKM